MKILVDPTFGWIYVAAQIVVFFTIFLLIYRAAEKRRKKD